MRTLVLFALLLVGLMAVSQANIFGHHQATGVRGRLNCGGRPATGVKVKLIDEDSALDPDDVLDEKTTTSSGSFEVKGSAKEFTTIDAFIKIYHDCDDGLPCQRRWKMKIPKKYINNGKEPKKILDLGDVNLEIRIPEEDRDCSH